MSDLRKAAEMVLEAWGWDWSEPRNEALRERMEALRQALAQPEQYDQTALELCDVCGWKTVVPDEGCLNCKRQALAQPEQEPVAWMKTWSDGNRNLYLYKPPHFDDNEIDPLYTALPKREWIDLTEDEAFACRGLDFFDTYKNINAKLKEKNT